MSKPDAIVVGSGPNGLGCAIALADAGMQVDVREAASTLGGGARSAELTEPGFVHDVCASILPLGAGSPFFQTLNLAEHGLDWVHPDAPIAHSFQDGRAVCLERSVEETAAALGADAKAYQRLYGPLTKHWSALTEDALGPFPFPPKHPFLMAGFGLKALRGARPFANGWFQTEEAKALFAGIAAHSVLPLERAPSAAAGLLLGTAGHACNWPTPRGGTQRLADALIAALRKRGGTITANAPVETLAGLDTEGPIIFDTAPREMVRIAGDALPSGYHRAVERFEYGPGVCKVDYALSAPIPWRAAACARSMTVHVGGTLDEVSEAEAAAWDGRIAERPFLIVTQPSLFDASRAPAGKHTAWAYCHVPNGCDVDVSDRIDAEMERHAPGFRDVILARYVTTASASSVKNRNLVGGDLAGGATTLGQLFTRPVARWSPYTTPNPRLYLCSASTPPGGGVHGMCGWHAARAVLKRWG